MTSSTTSTSHQIMSRLKSEEDEENEKQQQQQQQQPLKKPLIRKELGSNGNHHHATTPNPVSSTANGMSSSKSNNNNNNNQSNNNNNQSGEQPRRSANSSPAPYSQPSSSQKPNTTTNTNTNNNRIQYGAAIPVTTAGTFPQAGSILGPYFCLGTLGKGTFSSIHKCINLDYGHRTTTDGSSSDACHHQASSSKNNSEKCRLAAAKVELSTFVNSGVLLGEALVLHFLDEALPKGTVPVYLGHYTAGEAAAIVMEYLPGEDMHQLRENRNAQSPTGRAPRRLTIDDAVYLTADVMLPLLEQMHKVGIVHRDVKPSNCVRSEGRNFCMVDFGLSKSIVVPRESGYADAEHPWPAGQPWLIPPSDTTNSSAAAVSSSTFKTDADTSSLNNPQSTHQPGCFRKERTSADFRGTSMYASPRVHQGRDYCPRDDVWSLLYVFCDLVSGGLPWMSHAANRDRDMCQKVKEQVHGLAADGTTALKDESEKLLMGDDYHVSMFKQEQKEKAEKEKLVAASTNSKEKPGASSTTMNGATPKLPKPLDMAQDKAKVKLLRQAFSHLAKLQFWDQPDYNLIRRCIRGFLDEEGAVGEADDIEIEWTESTDKKDKASRKKRKRADEDANAPKWEFRGENCDPQLDEDPLVNNSEIFEGVVVAPPEAAKNALSEAERAVRRLPLEQQFRIAQMEYHAKNPQTALPHVVLQDWMKVAIPLLYKEWDAKAYEKGGHRTSSDGYRREYYLELVEKCSKWAKQFGFFSKKEFAGYQVIDTPIGIKVKEAESPPLKKRQIVTTLGKDSGVSCPTSLVSVSKVIFGLQAVSRAERAKSFAPPPLLSFGPSR